MTVSGMDEDHAAYSARLWEGMVFRLERTWHDRLFSWPWCPWRRWHLLSYHEYERRTRP